LPWSGTYPQSPSQLTTPRLCSPLTQPPLLACNYDSHLTALQCKHHRLHCTMLTTNLVAPGHAPPTTHMPPTPYCNTLPPTPPPFNCLPEHNQLLPAVAPCVAWMLPNPHWPSTNVGYPPSMRFGPSLDPTHCMTHQPSPPVLIPDKPPSPGLLALALPLPLVVIDLTGPNTHSAIGPQAPAPLLACYHLPESFPHPRLLLLPLPPSPILVLTRPTSCLFQLTPTKISYLRLNPLNSIEYF